MNELREEDNDNGVFTFQEDNAPCHKAAAAADRWKEENNVIILKVLISIPLKIFEKKTQIK